MPKISSKKVSPRGNPGSPILLIGEAPGFEEDRDGIAFVGDAGSILNRAIQMAGISLDDCYFMNLCNYRPEPNNEFHILRDTPQLKEGIDDIQRYISEHRDTIKLIILLGKEPLRYIFGKSGDGEITNWRGSFLQFGNAILGITYHPAFITRSLQLFPIFCHDFRKAAYVLSKGLPTIKYDFIFDPQGFDREEALREIENAEWIALDIEGSKKHPTHIRCFSVALSSTKAYAFYNNAMFGTGCDPVFFQTYQRVLRSKAKKIYHNGYSYDCEVQFLNGLPDGIDYDTIIAANSLDPEFPLGLDFLVSIHTWQPCYWSEGGAEEKLWSDKTPREKLLQYNAIDSCVLFTIKDAQENGNQINSNINNFKSEPLMLEDFKYKMSQIPLARHISRAGMPRDEERVKLLREVIDKKIQTDQQLLDSICGRHVNPNGKLVLRDVLFNQFKLPIRKNRKTGEVSADEDALVSLMTFCQDKINTLKTPELKFEWQKKLAALKMILSLRGLHKLKSSYVDISVSTDLRVRSTYKIPGTETNRWSCAKYVDKTGLNAQTFPREVMEYDVGG